MENKLGQKVNYISVLGSCVSRVSLLRGLQHEHGIVGGKDNNLELEFFLDKHNMAIAMLDAPFTREEVDTITADMLWDKSRVQSLKQQLNKETVPMLLEGKSNYLLIDLYDFHNYILAFRNTAFCSQANEFAHTTLAQKYLKEFKKYNLLELPTWVVYPMVDRFFDCIMQKFDSDHIILNRFRANKYMLHDEGHIVFVPEECKQDFQCHEKYNDACKALEDHIIHKYNPWVIDISRYFMGDANIWNNWNASHFEMEFYRETQDQIFRIVNGETDIRYYDKVQFFNSHREGFEVDSKRAFNQELNINVLRMLMNDGDDLWLNVLEQCYIRDPQNEELNEYMDMFGIKMR